MAPGGGGATVAESVCQPFPCGAPSGRVTGKSGRANDVALYTGNDDNILNDLLTPFDFGTQSIRIAGGLLGHWAVWTKTAVAQLNLAKRHRYSIPAELLTLAQQITAPYPFNGNLGPDGFSWPHGLPYCIDSYGYLISRAAEK